MEFPDTLKLKVKVKVGSLV